MPQRTHGPTTAAARPSSAAVPPVRELPTGKSGKRSRSASTAAAPVPVVPAQGTENEAGTHPLAPEAIARTLRAVAAALERDPALARRVAADAGYSGTADSAASAEAPAAEPSTPRDGTTTSSRRTFRPRLITGPDATLGPGIPDPFALRADRGEAALRALLEELRLGTLRAIIRAHHLDPSGRLARQNDAARLRALIVAATGEASLGE